MSASNPFRRKMVEDRDRSARSSLEGSCPPTSSSGDEFGPTQASVNTKATPPSIITTDTISDSALTSSASPPRIPPPVSPRGAKRRPLPPPPPPVRSASRRVSPVIEPHPAPLPPPPPPVVAIEPKVQEDPFEQALETSDDDEDVEEKDDDDEEEEPSVIVPLPRPPISRTPSTRSNPGALNPFRKPSDPVSNKRQSFDISNIRFGVGKAEDVSDDEIFRAPVRQSLDVEAFKRLILTGRIDPIEDGPGSRKGPQASYTVETKLSELMTENGGLVMNSNFKGSKNAISANPEAARVRAESISEAPPAPQQGATAVVMETRVEECPQATPSPPPAALNMSPPPSARVKPPPPRPRVRPSGSPNSSSSSSIQQVPTPTSSSTTPLATPIPNNLPPLPPLAISSMVPGDFVGTRQSPLPTPLLEEQSQPSANVPSPSVLKKPLPPSPPLSRMDSKRRSTLSPPSMTAGPAVSLSRSNSTSRKPPPPPTRRVQPSNSTTPISAVATGASITAIDAFPPPTDGLPASAKLFSPPPPPPRGTRRKGALGDSGSLASPITRIPSPIPILHPGPGIERLESGDVISKEPITPGTWAGGKNEVDILADLESLQRDVDRLKGMVEGRNGVVL